MNWALARPTVKAVVVGLAAVVRCDGETVQSMRPATAAGWTLWWVSPLAPY